MYSLIDLKNIEIKNPLDVIISRQELWKEKKIGWLIERTYTLMSFPHRIANITEKQVQKQNYDYFIHTMAEMVEKYQEKVGK